MKSLFFILLLPFTCLGQSDTLVDKAADALLMDSNANKAISYCKEFLHKNPQSKSVLRAFLIAGEACHMEKNDDRALYYYNELLKSNIDKDDNYYRNYAANYSANIFIQKKEYDKALLYLDEAGKKYHFKSFCGNAYDEHEQSTALAYAKCYEGLNKPQEAIDTLEPIMLPGFLTSHDEVADSIYPLYLKVHSKDAIKTEFSQSVNYINVISHEYDAAIYMYFIEAEVPIFSKKIKFKLTLEPSPFSTKQDAITNDSIKNFTIHSFKRSRIYTLATQ